MVKRAIQNVRNAAAAASRAPPPGTLLSLGQTRSRVRDRAFNASDKAMVWVSDDKIIRVEDLRP